MKRNTGFIVLSAVALILFGSITAWSGDFRHGFEPGFHKHGHGEGPMLGALKTFIELDLTQVQKEKILAIIKKFEADHTTHRVSR